MKATIVSIALAMSSVLVMADSANENRIITANSKGNGFASVGDTLHIPSLSIPTVGNFEVDLTVYSTANQFSSTWQVVAANPTTLAPSATYDLTTQLVHVPVKATFQGLNGPSCVVYDVYMGAYSGLWTIFKMTLTGTC